jgi:hypothetical protein
MPFGGTSFCAALLAAWQPVGAGHLHGLCAVPARDLIISMPAKAE